MSSELPLSTYSGFCLSQISSKVFCQKKVLCEPTLYSFCCCHCHVGDGRRVRKFLGNARTGVWTRLFRRLTTWPPSFPKFPTPPSYSHFVWRRIDWQQLVSLTFVTLSLSQNKSISGRPEVPFVHSVERIRMYGASKYKSFVLIFWLIFMSPRKPQWPGRTMVSKVCCREPISHCS